MSKKKITGGTGITAGEDVSFGDISGQVAIGENITQTQKLSDSDKMDLLENLIRFQKGIAKLDLPKDETSIINGDVIAAIKETKKENPDASKIKSRFEGAIENIKQVGNTIETVSKWEWTGKIVKILGKLGFSILL